jgi:hypothetical protein
MMPRREDPVLSSSRREACVVFFIWLAACVYTLGFCYRYGYGRDPATLTFVAGVPDWVFWGIFTPWTICTLVSFWIANFFMRDDDLGAERPEAELKPSHDSEAHRA